MKLQSKILRVSLATGALLGVLAGVFLMYARPDFLLQMANQIWACF